MKWVPGVSIGDEGGKFWPWHRDREEYFPVGHHRIGAAVVTSCRNCGAVLAAKTSRKQDAMMKAHNDLHERLEDLQDQIAHLYELLGYEGDDNGNGTEGTESGYIEPGYDVHEPGAGRDKGNDGGQ